MITVTEHKSIKRVEFSDKVTQEDLEKAASLFAEWASHKQPYAVITLVDSKAQFTQVGLPTMTKIFKEISGTHLHFYGVKSASSVATFLAKVVTKLAGVKLHEAHNQSSLIQRIREDNPVFAPDIDEMLEQKIIVA